MVELWWGVGGGHSKHETRGIKDGDAQGCPIGGVDHTPPLVARSHGRWWGMLRGHDLPNDLTAQDIGVAISHEVPFEINFWDISWKSVGNCPDVANSVRRATVGAHQQPPFPPTVYPSTLTGALPVSRGETCPGTTVRSWPPPALTRDH